MNLKKSLQNARLKVKAWIEDLNQFYKNLLKILWNYNSRTPIPFNDLLKREEIK